MKDKEQDDLPITVEAGSLLDEIRQKLFPAEFRIDAPRKSGMEVDEAVESLMETNTHTSETVPQELAGEPETETLENGEPEYSEPDNEVPDITRPADEHQAEIRAPTSPHYTRQLTEMATCLWYLKTSFFKTAWDVFDFDNEDPRVRRALSRIQKTLDKLNQSGIEIQDPVNKRYPPGSEGMMRPVQFLPADDVEVETVTETLRPIIFDGDRLLQRGEVFVAVPRVAIDAQMQADLGESQIDSEAPTDPGEVQASSDEKPGK